MSEPDAVVVGIAVATMALDVAVRPRREQRQRSHDAAGMAELIAWLHVVHPAAIVREGVQQRISPAAFLALDPSQPGRWWGICRRWGSSRTPKSRLWLAWRH